MRIFVLALFALFLSSVSSTVSAQNLVSSEFLQEVPLETLQNDFSTLLRYPTRLYKITYTTTDVLGVLDTASGLVVIPFSEGEDIEFPVLSYQHGTVGSRDDVPSNLRGGYELAMIFAARGYVAAATDMLGLGESRGIHPYVHAASEASAAIDMLFALDEFCAQNGVLTNDQLFITGYSQGGHAAMAMHQVVERDYSDVFTVTASAPMSGPYSISGEMKDIVLGDEAYNFPAYIINVALSFNLVYDLFPTPEEFFVSPYDQWSQNYANEEIDLFRLNLDIIERLSFGNRDVLPRRMLQDSIVDIMRNQPDHPINLALKDNDVYDWAPQAPTRMMYCIGDDQVTFRNAILADTVMDANGAPDVDALDPVIGGSSVNFDHGACVEPASITTIVFFDQFAEITVNNQEIFRESGLTVYPNPVSDQLLVEKLPAGSTVGVYDLQGRLLIQERPTESNLGLDVTRLNPGLYILQIQNQSSIWSEKIVVE